MADKQWPGQEVRGSGRINCKAAGNKISGNVLYFDCDVYNRKN